MSIGSRDSKQSSERKNEPQFSPSSSVDGDRIENGVPRDVEEILDRGRTSEPGAGIIFRP